jgi:IS30 family transposase
METAISTRASFRCWARDVKPADRIGRKKNQHSGKFEQHEGQMQLLLEEGKSDREIAGVLGVDHTTVGKWRRRLEAPQYLRRRTVMAEVRERLQIDKIKVSLKSKLLGRLLLMSACQTLMSATNADVGIKIFINTLQKSA